MNVSQLPKLEVPASSNSSVIHKTDTKDNSQSQVKGEKVESGSFLEKLASIFQSDDKNVKEASDKNLAAVKDEPDVQQTEQSDGEDEATITAVNSDGEVLKGEESDTEKEELSAVMNKGNELLERLADSNHALKGAKTSAGKVDESVVGDGDFSKLATNLKSIKSADEDKVPTIPAPNGKSQKDEENIEEQVEEAYPYIDWSGKSIALEDKIPLATGEHLSEGHKDSITYHGVLSGDHHSKQQTSHNDSMSQSSEHSSEHKSTQGEKGGNVASLQPFQAALAAEENDASIKGAMATALAANGSFGLDKKAGDLGENKEAHLSQDIAALAGQAGLQTNNSMRAEMTQAVQSAQAPLVLTPENASEKLSDNIQLMLSKNLKSVDIRLDPPEMGKVHIRLNMNNDLANVQFTVTNQHAREMIEQSMPKLREMLSQQGVQLADTSVSQQNTGSQQQQAQQQHQQAANTANNGRSHLGFFGESDGDFEAGTKIDLNVKEKADGISYYA